MSKETMVPKGRTQFVWVKDKAGNEYACPVDVLKKPEDMTESEKITVLTTHRFLKRLLEDNSLFPERVRSICHLQEGGQPIRVLPVVPLNYLTEQ